MDGGMPNERLVARKGSEGRTLRAWCAGVSAGARFVPNGVARLYVEEAAYTIGTSKTSPLFR